MKLRLVEDLRREREARRFNRIEPTPEPARSADTAIPQGQATAGEKPSARGGSRKVLIAAIDAILVEKKVPEAKRQAVLAAAEQQFAQMARRGHVPKVKVYERSAERSAQVTTPAPDLSRQQDRQQDRAPTPPVR